MKKYCMIIMSLFVVACGGSENVDVSSASSREDVIVSEESKMLINSIEKIEKEEVLVKETVKLLDDKIFWRKSTDMSGLTKATFKYNVTTPIDDQRKKWDEFKQSEAYKSCEGALMLFTTSSLEKMNGESSKESNKMFDVTYQECKSFIKK